MKKDESRHISYGTYLLSRLICEEDQIWDVVNNRIQLLLPSALGVVNELFDDMYAEVGASGEGEPFQLDQQDFVNYALRQFQMRMNVLERARGKSVEEIYQFTDAAVGIEE